MWAFSAMHNIIPHSITEYISAEKAKLNSDETAWNELKKEFLLLQSVNPHATVLEYVSTIWKFDGVSRSFQQQLTRHRQASYSIASLRIVPMETFYDEDEYTVPDAVEAVCHSTDSCGAKTIYHTAMANAQNSYNELRKIAGIKTEDARGVLPLNVQSPITMCINLRSFIHMAEVRLCHLAQGEHREVVRQMIEETCSKMGEEFGVLFKKPCERAGKCTMPIFCGKMPYEQDEIYKSIRIEKWLKG
jgi:flavin-dependent thymidylate synthase